MSDQQLPHDPRSVERRVRLGGDMSDPDVREWRVDSSRGSVRVEAVWVEDEITWTELIAVVVGNHDHAVRRANQIVAEHAMLCAPYADDQHRGGHWLDVLPQRPRWAQ